MPIPNDPENRFWIDISSANPSRVDEFSPCLVGFLAYDHGYDPDLAGTGFVIGADAGANFAIVMTAKHVLTEGVHNIQRPVPRHAPSALFVPNSSTIPSLHEDKLRAFWMGSGNADMLFTRHLSYHDSEDLACCIVMPQESHAAQFKPRPIPLDTARPSVGDVVHMVSQSRMKVSNRLPPTGAKGAGQQFVVHRNVSIRIGTVTAIYPQGFRQYPWLRIPEQTGQ